MSLRRREGARTVNVVCTVSAVSAECRLLPRAPGHPPRLPWHSPGTRQPQLAPPRAAQCSQRSPVTSYHVGGEKEKII